MTSSAPVHIHALWDRPVIPFTGGKVILCLRLEATLVAPSHRAPLDIAFVLDRSGSMAGEPLELVKQGVSIALDFLDVRDRVALVTFDHRFKLWQELTPVTVNAVSGLRRMLGMVTAGGSTDLTQGWQQGVSQLTHSPSAVERIRRTILLTDGQANAGLTDAAAITDLASDYRRMGIMTTAIGVGPHFDERLLIAMAEAGGGNSKYIQHPAELPDFFAAETGDMTRIVARSPRLDLTLGDGITGALLNAFPATVRGQTLQIDLRDLVAGDALDLIMELDIPAGSGTRPLSATLWFGSGQSIVLALPALRYVPAEDMAGVEPDPEVVRKHALEQSTRARREAIRLDRAGDILGSRNLLRDASATLQAAPVSGETLSVAMEMMSLAEEDTAFDEHTRKRVTHESQAKSRGYRR